MCPGWALPDQASFSAGVQDVLCAYTIDSAVYSKSAGDLRALGTKATLPDFRMCVNVDKEDTLSLVTCAKAHRNELLIFPNLLVTGQPADVDTWTDENWAKFDAICTDFANALVGAPRKDVVYLGDVQDYDAAPIGGRRLFQCRAKPIEDGDLLPAGSIVDLASKKLKLVEGASSEKGKSRGRRATSTTISTLGPAPCVSPLTRRWRVPWRTAKGSSSSSGDRHAGR